MEQTLALVPGISVKKDEGADGTGIPFALVPADASLAIRELVLMQPRDGDPFLSILAPYFQLAEGETVDPDLLEREAQAAREAGCSTGMCPHVSPLTLRRAAEEGTLERIKIRTEEQNESVVYMYYDESAHLKQRPANERANQMLSKACAREEQITVYGEVFLARLSQQNLEPVALALDEIQTWAMY